MKKRRRRYFLHGCGTGETSNHEARQLLMERVFNLED